MAGPHLNSLPEGKEDAKRLVRVEDNVGYEGSLLTASCPLPITNYKEIVLAHGSGGKLSHQLIEKMVLPQFRNELLEPLHDGAIFSLGNNALRSAPIPTWSARFFFPAATLENSPCTERSTISRCAAHVRCIFRADSFSRKERRWRISGALCNRCARRLTQRA